MKCRTVGSSLGGYSERAIAVVSDRFSKKRKPFFFYLFYWTGCKMVFELSRETNFRRKITRGGDCREGKDVHRMNDTMRKDMAYVSG